MTDVADAAPPRGTVTFLFTDIQGSTELWEAQPDAMRRAVAAHDGLLSGVFEENGGYVFTTAGDSFATAFVAAGDAVAAAESIQRRLGEMDHPGVGALRVRIGLHTGTAELRDGDYFGHDVNLAARVMSSAHGGQILLTEVTAQLADAATEDLGDHHLKGITRPVRLHQLLADGLASDFPPPRTSGSPSNLPAPIDEFIGRGDDVARAQMLLDTGRLLTLVGTGGAGKTRLSIEIARDREHPGGVWFADLSAVDDEDQIASVIAAAAGLREAPGRPAGEQVIGHLRPLDALLVVDNCEHVVDGAADLIAAILAECPAVRVLATSREALEIPGEVVQDVGPLGLPEDRSSGALGAPAMQLLAERARAACPGDDPVAADVDNAIRVCRTVDGLPLALELAAARLRMMPMAQLADRLEDHLSVLDARRGRQRRHRRLDAVVEWSYELLTPPARLVFDRVSVFRGGFSLEAAEAVVADAEMPADGVHDELLELVEKSLLSVDRADGRFRLLETMRAFGVDRLRHRGDAEVDAVADRHLAWALGEVAELESAMRTDRQDAALQAARPDHDNHRAARRRAMDKRDFEAALRITASVPIDPSPERPGVLLDLLDRTTDAPAELEARASYTVAGSRFEAGDYRGGYPSALEAVARFGQVGDRIQQAYSKMMLAFIGWGVRADDVDELIADAISTFEELDDDMGQAYTNWLMGLRLALSGRADAVARDHAERAVALFDAFDAPFGSGHAHEGLGIVLSRSGAVEEGLEELIGAARRLHEIGEMGCLAHVLDAVAAVVVDRSGPGDLVEGARLVGLAARLREESGASPRPWEIDTTEACVAVLEAQLSPEELTQATAEGRGFAATQVVDALTAGRRLVVD